MDRIDNKHSRGDNATSVTRLLVVLMSLFCIAAQAQPARPPIWTLKDLQENVLESTSDTTFIVNFWATWCRPCVEELPSFIKLDSILKETKKPVRVLLVSLDFRKDIDTKLISFLQKRHISTSVVVFSDTDMNGSIEKVSADWSGAIPATLIVNNKQHIRRFYEQEFEFSELRSVISSLIGEI